tara:strand:+ start:3204 stop:3374 length:171 start_codon:yes stop_codon:yes gene_type:complete
MLVMLSPEGPWIRVGTTANGWLLLFPIPCWLSVLAPQQIPAPESVIAQENTQPVTA